MNIWVRRLLLIFFAAVFLLSAGMLASYFWDNHTQQSRYQELAQLLPRTEERPLPGQPGETTPAAQPETVTVTDPKTGKSREILTAFSQLYNLNDHIVGWLTVPGSVIDYPVMQTPEDPEYYLSRNFDKKTQRQGCLFLQAECDPFKPSDNVTIYGHHMRDGSMFGQLDRYRKPDFLKENPYIYFDTLEEKHTYEIICVFLTTATIGEGFPYHRFVDAQTEEEFADFVSGFEKIALYKTGKTAQYGDKLICLSTCEYSQENGRLVVVAKQVA